jgi:3-deoxy-7-phosphoheptulonate synthase
VEIMLIKMAPAANANEIHRVIDRIKECGYQAHVIEGTERTVIGAVGSNGRRSEIEALRAAPGVEDVIEIAHPFKLVSRQLHPVSTVVNVAGIPIGGDHDFVVIAGPCSVESREQLHETARAVKAAGGHMLRGGAYKPRTSPYDFQGLGVEALRLLREASDETGLPVVTEVMSEADVDTQHAELCVIEKAGNC